MRHKDEILENILGWKGRIVDSYFEEEDGFIGIKGFLQMNGEDFAFMASNGGGWEHVSVSTKHRCPDWSEMCYVKNIFWKPEDAVMQLHPPESGCVDNHQYCLHLWRPTTGKIIPLPPKEMV